jgi:hypothetical protein
MFKNARSPARPSRHNTADEASRHLRGGDVKRRAMLSSHLLQPPQVECACWDMASRRAWCWWGQWCGAPVVRDSIQG